MTRYKSAVQKRNAAVLLRKPGRLASQYAKRAYYIDIIGYYSPFIAPNVVNGRFFAVNGI